MYNVISSFRSFFLARMPVFAPVACSVLCQYSWLGEDLWYAPNTRNKCPQCTAWWRRCSSGRRTECTGQTWHTWRKSEQRSCCFWSTKNIPMMFWRSWLFSITMTSITGRLSRLSGVMFGLSNPVKLIQPKIADLEFLWRRRKIFLNRSWETCHAFRIHGWSFSDLWRLGLEKSQSLPGRIHWLLHWRLMAVGGDLKLIISDPVTQILGAYKELIRVDERMEYGTACKVWNI